MRPHAGISELPATTNTAGLDYRPGTPERNAIEREVAKIAGSCQELPMRIGAQRITSERTHDVVVPHDHQNVIGRAHWAARHHVEAAINAARDAWPQWSGTAWEERAAIFLRTAELIRGPWRTRLNAATMVNLSKTVREAEIDVIMELADYLTFNAEYMRQMYEMQPLSEPGAWNRLEYRPLEGFVAAITPFNFTTLSNLAIAPAMMGNTVVWKPAEQAELVASYVVDLLEEAGLPPGVINLIYGDGPEIGETLLNDANLAGVHFTGSTDAFRSIWTTIGANIHQYRSYPRIVGETGGKNFIVVHESADIDEVETAVLRGAFEYQGQKCSAASRLYVPNRLWASLQRRLQESIPLIGVGDPTVHGNFVGAVIDHDAYTKNAAAIAEARSSPHLRVVAGGATDDTIGWMIHPTVIETTDPGSRLLAEELFGPVITVLPYDDGDWSSTLKLVDEQTPYGLTGAVFGRDRYALVEAEHALRYSAGNFYINDKPTGSVVGLQPFGGSRASGTNDKATSIWNLSRWVSMRATKENLLPPKSWPYPFLGSA